MIRKMIISAALLAMGMAFTAQADDMEVTKTATKDFGTIMRPEFGLIDYRYYYIQNYNGDDLAIEDPIHQARATLGFTLLNKVDTTFIFAGNKENQSQKLTNRQPQMVAVLPVVKGDQFNMGVYADVRFPVTGKANTTEIGINPSFVQPLSSEWSLSFESEFDLIFSNNENASVEDAGRSNEKLLLADPAAETPEYTGVKKDPSFEADVIALAKYKPAALASKLTVAAGIEVDTLWEPEYKPNDEGVVEATYKDNMLTINRLKIDYQATENLTVTNDFYHTTSGFYEERLNGYGHHQIGRVMNRIGLSYSLF